MNSYYKYVFFLTFIIDFDFNYQTNNNFVIYFSTFDKNLEQMLLFFPFFYFFERQNKRRCFMWKKID